MGWKRKGPRDRSELRHAFPRGGSGTLKNASFWALCFGWFPTLWSFPVGAVVKNPPANAGGLRDANLIPGLGRSPRGGHSNTLQDSCLENPTDTRAGWATVQGVSKFQACLNLLNRHTTLWLPLLEVYFLKPYFLPSVASRM